MSSTCAPPTPSTRRRWAAPKALGRDDIGRLAKGAKADIVLVDVTHPMMRPLRDPIRSLVYAAGERAVTTVIVDGVTVVENGKVLTMDYASRRSRAGRGRSAAPSRRSRGSTGPAGTISRYSPLTFPPGK